ncbi:PqiC family protein [Acinetobacter sp. 1125_18A]|uniref:PqiC family protein n=1 Tax=Acinetobacter sp. 1125_18A TaxID=2605959 RepID=UPI004059ED03
MLNKKNSSHFLSYLPQSSLAGCALLLAVVGLTGCSSSPTPNYYSLTPTVKPLVSSNVRVIEVLPVGLPDRLNRAPLVLQDSSGKSNVLDNERWTSTLGAELRDGLSAGLQQKLGAVDRYSSGMTGGKVSYRIATDFSRFDIIEHSNTRSLNRDIEVAVAWIIKRDDPARPLNQPTGVQNAVLPNRQLSCRMAFTDAVGADGNKIVDIVSVSRQSLSKVVEAIAASVVATEANKAVVMEGVICA